MGHRADLGLVLKTIGDQIRRRRNEMGLTRQADLAAQVGLSKNQIGRIERGEVDLSLSRLVALAKALRVSPAYFLQPLMDFETERLASHQAVLEARHRAAEVLAGVEDIEALESITLFAEMALSPRR